MGSFQRNKSSHWIDMKGKGILYDEDDEPIKLTDQDTPQNITEFHLSLIGKILNPKKQNVEKLLQKMPSQWGMEDRITANDLGNGKFLLNFTTEDDLNSVLRQRSFHFNFCMFVLVRWEPIVHDDYPWIIPFWTRLIGVPLHLWTVNNLKGIGARLGHVHQDQIELMEGRMLIDIDTRRPLKFARKAESPEGDEVTIEIKYEMLFKHCSTCGLLTHEKEYCPSLIPQDRINPPGNRPGVFARVQVPEARSRYKPVKKEPVLRTQTAHPYSEHKVRQFNDSRYGNSDRSSRGDSSHGAYSREGNSGHVDRIIRRRDDHTRSSRYGGSRVGTGPYDHYRGDGNSGVAWREKRVQPRQGTEGVVRQCLDAVPVGKDSVSYGHTSTHSNALTLPDRKSSESKISEETHGNRRLASTIVTPSRIDHEREENVTKRPKVSPRVLSFESLSDKELEMGDGEDRIIDALTDMDIADKQDDGLMDCDVQNDDLMGLELAEMEEKTAHIKSAGRAQRGSKHGSKMSAPLGIQNKKFGILRRGSPHKRSSSSHDTRAVGEKGRSRHHHLRSKKQKSGLSKNEAVGKP
ncbi:hypothetical protein Bca52824_048476 [Brassica carinata]|uniref:DUF4283 domain-containing protein n=1 Tax=Brassica carinata TaxID=52824 RepID=A0A8X7US78_BRACI|nr:hypothetical protein Bca52824_048476 [Brassica carinata]